MWYCISISYGLCSNLKPFQYLQYYFFLKKDKYNFIFVYCIFKFILWKVHPCWLYQKLSLTVSLKNFKRWLWTYCSSIELYRYEWEYISFTIIWEKSDIQHFLCSRLFGKKLKCLIFYGPNQTNGLKSKFLAAALYFGL